MSNAKEYFNQLDAIAVTELDDEVAATSMGGAAVTLYENGNFNKDKDGRVLLINSSTRNVGSFNDLTSSFKISKGVWEFYADENNNNLLFTYGPGQYPVVPTGSNDRVTSLKRIK